MGIHAYRWFVLLDKDLQGEKLEDWRQGGLGIINVAEFLRTDTEHGEIQGAGDYTPVDTCKGDAC